MSKSIITRIFKSNSADKGALACVNEKGGACPNIGTKFTLTGNFTVEDGWTDRNGTVQNKDRKYAYFEGTRNGKEVSAGVGAGIFLRRPYDGFTAEEEKSLTPFHKSLLDCLDASDLYDLFERENAFSKSIVVKAIVRHNETPYGGDKEKPVRYAVFDLE